MGVYLAVIGVADRLYQGTYVWKDVEWRHSTACKMAGFLSLMSSEVSAFLICLITLDRFLVLQFPFSQLRFRNTSSHVACVTVWCLGLLLAAVPLLPMTSYWYFYSHTGICIPLPVTRKKFAGQKYSFSIMIVMNFVLFLLIAAGQGVVYCSIQSNRMSSTDSTQKSKDQTIARRLITVVMSDFLCWFPIGVLGLLASQGVMIPGEASVFLAIIILPLNASLNPFLYTLNILQDRQRRAKESLREKRIMSQLQAKISSSVTPNVDKFAMSYTKEEIRNLVQKWLDDELLTLEVMSTISKEATRK
ncbi:relaxin receptor 2-like [Babylonia areolata]|uniref:relaxin receptor 2-like n=1 Tax=Babylonia areolata TaxID=304850 RepID=UPI003FD55109